MFKNVHTHMSRIQCCIQCTFTYI